MGLKCSLLGHDFGDTEIEREREERGDEVVITSREVETCRRCGEEHVVSENKEVTTVTPAAEVEAEPEPEPGAGGDAIDASDETAAPTDATAPETSVEEPPAEPDAGSPAGGLESAIEQVEDEEEFTSPEEDDAVILDADEEAEERQPGEWPDEPTDEQAGAAGTPDEPAPDEATTGQEEAAGATVTDPGDTAAADTEGADEATAAEVVAETDTDDAAVWSEGMEESSDTDSAFATAEDPAIDTDTIPEGSFYCPECGFHEPATGSSLRAGDACPDCHRGYLEHKGS